MAPLKAKAGATKSSNKRSSKADAAGSSSKFKSKSTKQRSIEQKKKKPSSSKDQPKQKKKRIYTEKELNIPALNMITPAGVQKPKGKKKGKVFVDGQESMTTILAMVLADKEGQIESKMMKARQMEEIRQARQLEMDARHEDKRTKLEDTKDSLRRSKKRKPSTTTEAPPPKRRSAGEPGANVPKKRVSFG